LRGGPDQKARRPPSVLYRASVSYDRGVALALQQLTAYDMGCARAKPRTDTLAAPRSRGVCILGRGAPWLALESSEYSWDVSSSSSDKSYNRARGMRPTWPGCKSRGSTA